MAHGFFSKGHVYAQTKDRVCSRKRKFPSFPAAESEIRRLALVGELNAYECPYCSKFHIGHPPKGTFHGISSRDTQSVA